MSYSWSTISNSGLPLRLSLFGYLNNEAVQSLIVGEGSELYGLDDEYALKTVSTTVSPYSINGVFNKVDGNNVTWVALTSDKQKVLVSTDSGIRWRYVKNAPDIEIAYSGIYHDGKYIICGKQFSNSRTSSSMFYTTDLTQPWTAILNPLTTVRSIAYNGSYFIAVGKGPGASIIKSTDGITWTALTDDNPMTEGYAVYWMDYWIAMGDNGGGACVFTALEDGNLWITIDGAIETDVAPFTSAKSAVAYGSKLYIVGDFQGSTLSGAINLAGGQPEDFEYTGLPVKDFVTYDGTRLLGFDSSGKLTTSTNGTTWTTTNITGITIPKFISSTVTGTQSVDFSAISTLLASFNQLLDSTELKTANDGFINILSLFDSFKAKYTEVEETVKILETNKKDIEDLKDYADNFITTSDISTIKRFEQESTALNSQISTLGSAYTAAANARVSSQNTYVNANPKTDAMVQDLLEKLTAENKAGDEYRVVIQERLRLLQVIDDEYKRTYEGPIQDYYTRSADIVTASNGLSQKVTNLETEILDLRDLLREQIPAVETKFDDLKYLIDSTLNTNNDDTKSWKYSFIRKIMPRLYRKLRSELSSVYATNVVELYNDYITQVLDGAYPNAEFTTINSLFESLTTLVNNASTYSSTITSENTAIQALYDIEDAQDTRQTPITFYTGLINTIGEDIADNNTYSETIIEDAEERRIAYAQQAALDAAAQAEAQAAADLAETQRQQAEEQAALIEDAIAQYEIDLQNAQTQEEQDAIQALINAQQALLDEQNGLITTKTTERDAAQLEADQAEAEKLENEAAAAALQLRLQAEQAELARLEARRAAYQTFINNILSYSRKIAFIYYKIKNADYAFTVNKLADYFSDIGRGFTYFSILNLHTGVISTVDNSFAIYDNTSVYSLSYPEITNLFIDDYKSFINKVILFFNALANGRTLFEDYLNAINVTADIAKIKQINNTSGTTIETKLNNIKSEITTRLNTINRIYDITVTLPTNLGTTGGTHYANISPKQSITGTNITNLLNNSTTNLDLNIFKKFIEIQYFTLQYDILVAAIREMATTKRYLDEKTVALTAARNQIETILDTIFDYTNSETAEQAFADTTTTLENRLAAIANTTFPIFQQDNIYTTNDVTDMRATKVAFTNRYRNQRIAIGYLIDQTFQSKDDIYEDNGSNLTAIASFLNTKYIEYNRDIWATIWSKINPAYISFHREILELNSTFSPHTIVPNLLISDLYNEYNYNVSDSLRSVTNLIYNLQFAANAQLTFNNANNLYLDAVEATIQEGNIPYPLIPLSENPGTTNWVASYTRYNTLQATLNNSTGSLYLERLREFLQTFSLQTILDANTLLNSKRLRYITQADVRLNEINSTDVARIRQAYLDSVVLWVGKFVQEIEGVETPRENPTILSDSELQRFGILNEVNTFQTFERQLVNSINVIPLTESNQVIRNFTQNLKVQRQNFLSNLQTINAKIKAAKSYNEEVIKYRGYVDKFKRLIDRKERVCSNFMARSFTLLESSDGIGSPFLMGIKPSNSSYWTPVTGVDDLNFVEYDGNMPYYLNDRVSFNNTVYELTRATPVYNDETFEVFNKPPIVPNETLGDYSFSAFRVNTTYWESMGAFKLNDPVSLGSLRSRNGNLYECIKAFEANETVTNADEDPIHWKFIPRSEYSNYSGVPNYYDPTERYIEDEEVLYDFPYLNNPLYGNTTETSRLFKYKAVKKISEEYPEEVEYARLQMLDELDPDSGFVDPDTNEVDPETQINQREWVGGNFYKRGVPKYGEGYIDPWRIGGLAKDLRKAIAYGPELAIYQAYNERYINDGSYYRFESSTSPISPQRGDSTLRPSDHEELWTALRGDYLTQRARLTITDSLGTPYAGTTELRKAVQPYYDKAYPILIDYIDDRTEYVRNRRAEINVKKQQFYSLVLPDIEDNISEFINPITSAPGKVYLKDLGIGSPVFGASFFNNNKAYVEEREQQITDEVIRIQQFIAAEITEYVVTSTFPHRGGILLPEAVSELSLYIPIRGILTSIADTDVNNTLADAEPNLSEFSIIPRYKLLLREAIKPPQYVADEAAAYLTVLPSKGVGQFANAMIGLLGAAFETIVDPFGIYGLVNSQTGNTSFFAVNNARDRELAAILKTLSSVTAAGIGLTKLVYQTLETIENLKEAVEIAREGVAAANRIPTTPVNLTTIDTTVPTYTPPTFPETPDAPKLKAIQDNTEALQNAEYQLRRAKQQLRDLKKPKLDPLPDIITSTTNTRIQAKSTPSATRSRAGVAQEYIRNLKPQTVNEIVRPEVVDNGSVEARRAIEASNKAAQEAYDLEVKRLEQLIDDATNALTEQQRIAFRNTLTELENNAEYKRFAADIDKNITDIDRVSKEASEQLSRFKEEFSRYADNVESQTQANLKAVARRWKEVAQKRALIRTAQANLEAAIAAQRAFMNNFFVNLVIDGVSAAQKARIGALATARAIGLVRVYAVVIRLPAAALSRLATVAANTAVGRAIARVSGPLSRVAGPIFAVGGVFLTAWGNGAFEDLDYLD